MARTHRQTRSERKWYSDGLTSEDAEKATKDYAKIENPVYGLTDGEGLALQFHLSYASGRATDWHLADQRDIKELLLRTKSSDVSKLEGRVIEVYSKERERILIGISVNPHLI